MIFFVLNIVLILLIFCCCKSKIEDLIEKCLLYIYKNNYKKNEVFKELRNKYLHDRIDIEYKKYMEKLLGRRTIHNIMENNYYFFIIYSYKDNINEYKKFLIDDEINDLDYLKYKKIEYRRNCCQIFWSIFRTDYNFLKIFSCLMKYKIYIIEIMIYLNSLIISIIINLAFYTDRTMHKIYDNEGNYNLLNSLPQILISNISMEIISFGFEKLIDFQDKLIDLKNNLGISKRETEEKEKDKKEKEDKKQNTIIYSIRKNIIETGQDLINENKKSEITLLNANSVINAKQNNLINNSETNTENIGNKPKNSGGREGGKKDKIADDIRKSFRCRSIIFSFIVVFVNIFGWYYVSCFSAVYKNTQKQLFKDFGFSNLFNLIICILISLIKLFIQLLKKKENFNFMIWTDNKVIKFIIQAIIFIIEMLLEYYIIYCFSKIIN